MVGKRAALSRQKLPPCAGMTRRRQFGRGNERDADAVGTMHRGRIRGVGFHGERRWAANLEGYCSMVPGDLETRSSTAAWRRQCMTATTSTVAARNWYTTA